tara:strand:- start:590 stop:1054 length:465 start_codon:yes stop_codon:yes gene_type:complete
VIRVYTSETDLQKSVVKFLDLVLPKEKVLHHSPNEGKHKVHYLHKQKLMGVMSGFPDLMILIKGVTPLFIELKQPGNYPTEQQRDMGTKLIGLGCEYAVCRSISEVSAFLQAIPNLTLNMVGQARIMLQVENKLQKEIDDEKERRKKGKAKAVS